MGLSVSPVIRQYFIAKVIKEIPNRGRCIITMDAGMIFSTDWQYFQSLANLFSVSIKFRLKFSPHICQIFQDQLIYTGVTFLLKDGKSSYKPMREKCHLIIKLKAPKSLKDCIAFHGIFNFYVIPPQISQKTFHIKLWIIGKNKLQWEKECEIAF